MSPFSSIISLHEPWTMDHGPCTVLRWKQNKTNHNGDNHHSNMMWLLDGQGRALTNTWSEIKIYIYILPGMWINACSDYAQGLRQVLCLFSEWEKAHLHGHGHAWQMITTWIIHLAKHQQAKNDTAVMTMAQQHLNWDGWVRDVCHLLVAIQQQ